MKKKLIILTIIVFLATVMYFISSYPKTQITTCTQEVLVCPDGSTVGRRGSNCQFSPCPNNNLKPSITPIIKKYLCPKTEWIDCMPGTDKIKAGCDIQYLQWAQENCPGFKGAAY